MFHRHYPFLKSGAKVLLFFEICKYLEDFFIKNIG